LLFCKKRLVGICIGLLKNLKGPVKHKNGEVKTLKGIVAPGRVSLTVARLGKEKIEDLLRVNKIFHCSFDS
jgi:hypothetical protein